ncbi:MAG: hypothetical protein ACF8MJ_00665 [Phycisphaerales bacterium JB050]
MHAEHAQPEPRSGRSPRRSRALFRIDAGWLFLLSGLAVMCAAVLIPAHDDLALTQYERDRARAIETWHASRVENYAKYLDALREGDETLVMSLAAMQLNLIPANSTPLVTSVRPQGRSASVFPDLEPTFVQPKPPEFYDSTLRRWATDGRSRLWMIAGGAMLVLFGLLPPSRSQA